MGNDINTDLLKNMMMGGGIKESSNKSYNNKRNHSGNGNSRNNRDNRDNNRSNHRNNNGNNNNYSNGTPSYIGNPYNFVGFSKKVYEYPQDKLTLHSDMKDELFTGELTYEVEAKTKIIVDDGNGSFYKNTEGKYAIPASTMRGLIRNNVQILGLSSFYDDIDDYALMYRNVANGAEKKRYNDILGSKQLRINDGDKSYAVGILLNVRAGYIKCEHGKYLIYQNEIESIKKEYKGMNYYALSERNIYNSYEKSKKNGTKFRYDIFYKDGKSIMQHEMTGFRRDERNGRVHYKGNPNKNYVPYAIPVSYEIANQKDVTAVGEPGQYAREGYAVSTGKMNEKKVIYIIPKVDLSKLAIEIPQKDIDAFRIDLEKKKNSLKQFGGRDKFDLPKEGDMKPVFYIELGGRLYFGFTPRLRLFYDYTIKEGLPQNHKEGVIDYAKAMFGFTGKRFGYKSKLSFSDAVLVNESSVTEERKYILSEPKPSSYLDYLVQDADKEVTYNTQGFQVRGIKQYWLRNAELPDNVGNGNEKALSKFTPLAAGAKFQGKVRFSNLTKDELGLLLWSVQLREESWMNVGKAKAYGYGNIKVKLQSAKKVDMKKAYATSEFCFDPFEDINISECIGYYKACMKDYLDGKELETLPSIKEFFDMKNSKIMPDPKKIRYMDINNREYQNRKEPLGQTSDYVRNENVTVQNQ